MKVNNIPNITIINSYKKNSNIKSKDINLKMQDSCEISSLAKTLNSFSAEEVSKSSEEKIQKIKNEIEKGTYKVDSKLIAERLVEYMKGKRY